MFDRFTEGAKRAVADLAQEEARRLRRKAIGPEQLLLGILLVPDSLGAKILQDRGMDIREARKRVLKKAGMGKVDVRGELSYTPASKKVLELTLREWLMTGDSYIGTEHILLGLVRHGQGTTALILRQHGLNDTDDLRKEIKNRLSMG